MVTVKTPQMILGAAGAASEDLLTVVAITAGTSTPRMLILGAGRSGVNQHPRSLTKVQVTGSRRILGAEGAAAALLKLIYAHVHPCSGLRAAPSAPKIICDSLTCENSLSVERSFTQRYLHPASLDYTAIQASSTLREGQT